tara:strand:+ start:571 stop:831 length:261 start_codon:yes stop_codon:yes gene_type:complete
MHELYLVDLGYTLDEVNGSRVDFVDGYKAVREMLEGMATAFEVCSLMCGAKLRYAGDGVFVMNDSYPTPDDVVCKSPYIRHASSCC